MNLDELKAVRDARSIAYYAATAAIDNLRNEKLRAAKEQIELSLTVELNAARALRTAMFEAEKAVEDELIRLALDGLRSKWPVGTRLKRTVGGYGSRSVSVEFGVLEVVTRETEFPDNTASYNKPHIGDLIIRLCNKDGNPGKRFYDSWRGQEWSPVE